MAERTIAGATQYPGVQISRNILLTPQSILIFDFTKSFRNTPSRGLL